MSVVRGLLFLGIGSALGFFSGLQPGEQQLPELASARAELQTANIELTVCRERNQQIVAALPSTPSSPQLAAVPESAPVSDVIRDTSSGTKSLQLTRVPLKDALLTIAALGEINLSIANDVSGEIDVNVTARTWKEALRALILENNLATNFDTQILILSKGVSVLEREELLVRAVDQAAANASGGSLRTDGTYDGLRFCSEQVLAGSTYDDDALRLSYPWVERYNLKRQGRVLFFSGKEVMYAASPVVDGLILGSLRIRGELSQVELEHIPFTPSEVAYERACGSTYDSFGSEEERELHRDPLLLIKTISAPDGCTASGMSYWGESEDPKGFYATVFSDCNGVRREDYHLFTLHDGFWFVQQVEF